MRVLAPVAIGLATALVAAGCSSSGTDGTTTPSDGDASGEVVNLEFWSWPVGTDKIVEDFNATHPNIQVNLTDAGGGDDSAAKLLTAVRSGEAPDVSTVEYTTLPSLVIAGAVADISPYAGDIQDAFTEGTWAQTTFDGVTYAVPQDVGPAAMIYNSAALQEYGAEVPVTWQDYREAAQTVREANSDAYIGAFPPSELGFWASVSAQAGSQWWAYEDGAWSINIGDDASQEVADFFQGMYEDDLISVEGLLTAEYNSKLNSNEMLSWPSALWATGVIQGVAEDSQFGNWRMTNFPQWNAGDKAVPYQGGSSLVVTSTSEHPEAAMEFISWFNASEEGANDVLTMTGSYPASVVGQELSTSQEVSPLVEGQDDYYDLAAEIASDTVPVSWGPNVAYAKTVLDEELSAAIVNGTSWADAFVATGDAVRKDLVEQGYDVAE